MPTPCWLKHLCSIRALGPVSFFFFLSLSLSQAISLERRGSLSSLSCPGFWDPLEKVLCAFTHWEGTWGLCEQSKPCAGALLAFCVNQGISASSSPLLSYHRLRTTRFQSIKGPQQRSKCLLISWSQSPSAVILESKKIKFVMVSILSPSICHEVMDRKPCS